ncbi:hypothetical protein [Brochothrix thermosphacta]|uniref:hypothetical protein n=1 Tax=Brochothrix thermosphacta TaxID=2756 RepID=UPI003F9583E4
MLPSIVLWAFGLVLTLWGLYSMNRAFKKNKTKNNLIQLLLTGEASGIRQFISGIVTIAVGFVVLYFQNK